MLLLSQRKREKMKTLSHHELKIILTAAKIITGGLPSQHVLHDREFGVQPRLRQLKSVGGHARVFKIDFGQGRQLLTIPSHHRDQIVISPERQLAFFVDVDFKTIQDSGGS
jgi:hypothetical protein